MAVSTLLAQWTASTTNRGRQKLVQTIRDFLQTNGWTIVDDMTVATWTYGGQARHAIVVTYNRNTGFSGDNPLVIISSYVASSVEYLYLYAIESWNTSTKAFTGMATGRYAFTVVSYTSNMNFHLSCDSTFIVMTSSIAGVRQSNALSGVCCFERYAGDQDLGTFYGSIVFNSNSIGVPRSWSNTTVFGSNGTSSDVLNFNTLIGANWTAMTVVDQAGNDVIFPVYITDVLYGRHKGIVYGMRVTSNRAGITDGTTTGVIDGNDWYIVKSGTTSGCMPYATPTVVT